MITQTRYVNAERCGARIRALREEQGLSTTALAKKAGFSQQQICQVELGKINTPIETLGRIAEALGVSLAFLAGGEQGPTQGLEIAQLAALKELCRLYPREQWAELGGTMAKLTEVLANYSQLKFMDEYQYALA